MKIKICTVFLLFMHLVARANPSGYWITFDDKTKQPRSIIRIEVDDKRVLNAVIQRVYPKPGDTGHCHDCPGTFENQPVRGMRFVWGLQHVGHHKWDRGHIIDPAKGRIYDCQIVEQDDPQWLKVRGYIKLPFIGLSKYWRRATAKEIAALT